jgi:hypothetical protein
MFGYGQQFDVGEAHFFDIRDELLGQLPVG